MMRTLRLAASGLSLALMAIFLISCSVPAYDEVADKSTIALQKKIDEQFFTLASLLRQQRSAALNKDRQQKLNDELSYSKSAPFYAQTYAEIAAIQTRLASAETEAVSRDSIDGWFNHIRNVVMNTEAEHQAGKLDPDVLAAQRVRDIDGTMRSISTYMLVTKPASKK